MNYDVPIKQRLQAKAALAGIPILGTFELTPRCNFQCKMCYVRLTPEEMQPLGRERTAEEWLSLGRTAFDAGMTFLLLTGGEPLLRPDFPQIYEGLAKLGLSVSLNTNGTLISEEIRALFLRYPPAQVNITLYGTTRETYAALCGNADGFDRVTDALHWLKAQSILVNLNATLTPWNVNEWAAMEAFAAAEQLNYRPTIYTFPPARRSSADNYARLSAEKIGRMLAAKEVAGKSPEHIKQFLQESEYVAAPQKPAAEGEPLHCFAGKSQFWVAWNGKMTPCGMLNCPQSDPFETSFREAWEEIKAETAKIRLCPDCVSCAHRKFCATCAAVNHAETGSFSGKPEYMCRMTQTFVEFLRAAIE
ncbi:MAG: radical SAM protein [Firmicutes bacterium]|nr:radical SAM protein [Bacillota bacterium]